MRLSVRSTIAVRLAYSPRWKFWNVSFGNGNVASRDSDRVSAGPELASDSNRSELPQFGDQVRGGLVDRVDGQGAELAQLLGSLDERVPLIGQHRERVGDGGQGPIEDGLLVGELADEAVEAVGGRDDVTGLVVEVCGEGVQLPNQPAQIVLTAGKRGAQRLGDVLNLAQSAAVEHQRQRCQRLLGAWVGATV